MPSDGYKTLTEDTPTEARVIPQPTGSGGHRPRLREVNVRIPRIRALRRRSLRENDGRTPILDEEQSCSFSSSSSPSQSPKCRRTCHNPCSDIEPSPSCTPKGCLVFLDSSPEREDNCEKTVIVPPQDVLLPPLGPEATVSDFEPDLAWTGSPPQTPTGCLNVTASSGPICRICHEGDQPESLVSLCKCSGTVGVLHVSCLERWLNAQNVDHCELCHHRFPTTAQSSTVRRFFHWVLNSEARVQRAVLGDLFCFALLTPVAVLSCFLCVNSAARQALQGHIWEAASLVTLAGLLLTAYIAWSFLTVRFHCRSFESWRSRNPMRRIIAPFARGGDAGTESQDVNPRELMDVVIGSIGEVSQPSSPQRQGDSGNSRRVPLEPSPTMSPEDLSSEIQQPLYSFGPFASFVFW
ncbi:hypothetical protein V5799_014410 [Amblyomma americanum]|uniref:RING-CH-type domain-containing protein n=1 Tax=Amblyomma americanum TaxID=6943 RepID=A0AAQ4E354_AMBAM